MPKETTYHRLKRENEELRKELREVCCNPHSWDSLIIIQRQILLERKHDMLWFGNSTLARPHTFSGILRFIQKKNNTMQSNKPIAEEELFVCEYFGLSYDTITENTPMNTDWGQLVNMLTMFKEEREAKSQVIITVANNPDEYTSLFHRSKDDDIDQDPHGPSIKHFQS